MLETHTATCGGPERRGARSVARSAVDRLPPAVRLTKRAMMAWVSGEPELRFLRRLCARNEWALDIGANYGVYSWHLRHYAAGVVAFEPQPLLAAFLSGAFGTRLRVEQLALSDSAGEAVLRVPVDRMQDGRATIERENALSDLPTAEIRVPRRSLDDYLLGAEIGPIGFAKIDVEGHELAVLRGSEALLRRSQPTLLVEAEERHRHGALGSVAGFLETFGYRPHMVRDNRLYPLDPARQTASGNFIFIARPQLLAGIPQA